MCEAGHSLEIVRPLMARDSLCLSRLLRILKTCQSQAVRWRSFQTAY